MDRKNYSLVVSAGICFKLTDD